MSVTSNIIKYILILLISLLPVSSLADTYYGVLRGSESVKYKSPYQGFISLNPLREGDIREGGKIFTVYNYEYETKKKILLLKIKKEEKQKTRILRQYQDGLRAYHKGFLSKNEVNNYEDKLDDIELSLVSLHSELNSLNDILHLGVADVTKPFIVRNIDVANQQYVNSGDSLMSIEMLDSFFVDIKIDPVVFSGNIRDKNIVYVSLVDNMKGKATVVRISGVLDNTGTKTSGMRMVTLLIHGKRDLLQNLLDTAFEINIDD